jgi:hypothetical protein
MPEKIKTCTVPSESEQRIKILAVYPQASLLEIIKLYLMLRTIVSQHPLAIHAPQIYLSFKTMIQCLDYLSRVVLHAFIWAVC